MTTQHKSNRLINENSPYLLQHAYNPVKWYPWGNEAWDLARNSDLPVIVSIGYSACHWCHVMERESFENEDIATIMNENFVCIKVDREERPDVDQIYMDAVSAMGLHGGWPLNVFLTPDAKPFYGGTYFPPAQWTQVLNNVSNAFHQHREKIEESAEKFTDFLAVSNAQKYGLEPAKEHVSIDVLKDIYKVFSAKFDTENGGMDRAPKFPMPVNYSFLLRYYAITKDSSAIAHIKLTLDRMASGGIYDQVGGGFARYSVDGEWFAPHFEKMLYDNAQLISVYAEAYQLTGEKRYREVVFETIAFLSREMLSPENAFFTAIDADSEGIEGKFYVWKKHEINEVLGNESEPFSAYYHVVEKGNWEEGNNILHANELADEFALKNNIDPVEFNAYLIKCKKKLLTERAKRVRPGLDDKVLTNWNGLMLKALSDAYAVFHEPAFLDLAEKNALFIQRNLLENNKLYHSWKNGKAYLPGYLEDYAAVIAGYVALYQQNFNKKWLDLALQLTDYAITNFYDPNEEFFFFTDQTAEKLIARKKEIFDNVIPSSNSIMANNLYFLGAMTYNSAYLEISEKMLHRMTALIKSDPAYLANWACLYTYKISLTAEIAIIGKDYLKYKKGLDKYYLPNKVVAASVTENADHPLLKGRTAINGLTTIYVCFDKTCKLPVQNIEEAINQLVDPYNVK